MKIDANSGSIETKEYLERLDKSLKKRVVQKENEIEDVNKLYDKKIQSAKDQGEDSYLNVLDQNQKRVGSAVKEYEDKLLEYQKNLNNTQEKLTEQEKTLRDQTDINLYNIKLKGETSYQNQYSKIVDNERSLENDASNKMKNLESKTNSELKKQSRDAEKNVSALEHKQNLELNNRQSHFANQFDGQTKTNNYLLANQKSEFQNASQKMNEENKRTFDDKVRIEQDRLNFVDKYHQSLVLQKEEDFKKKYENMARQHQETLTSIESRFNEETRSLVDSKSKLKEAVVDKANDEFYHIKKLDPKILNHEKEMVFELSVPKHEWENVHLSAQGRNVKITLGRKYADEMSDLDGSRHRSSRNELFSREFKVDDILNPKTITQKYEDGVLSFKVAKL